MLFTIKLDFPSENAGEDQLVTHGVSLLLVHTIENTRLKHLSNLPRGADIFAVESEQAFRLFDVLLNLRYYLLNVQVVGLGQESILRVHTLGADLVLRTKSIKVVDTVTEFLPLFVGLEGSHVLLKRFVYEFARLVRCICLYGKWTDEA